MTVTYVIIIYYTLYLSPNNKNENENQNKIK